MPLKNQHGFMKMKRGEMMSEDEEVKEWVNKYGGVTSYSFMIYGPMTVKDNAIINKGLT